MYTAESRNSFMENSRFFISVPRFPLRHVGGVAALATRASASHPLRRAMGEEGVGGSCGGEEDGAL